MRPEPIAVDVAIEYSIFSCAECGDWVDSWGGKEAECPTCGAMYSNIPTLDYTQFIGLMKVDFVPGLSLPPSEENSW
jgi:tRNA(Ile2) C34 agmatinyltransferase TiaS